MGLRIEFDRDDLRPLIELVVAQAFDRLDAERAKFNGRFGMHRQRRRHY